MKQSFRRGNSFNILLSEREDNQQQHHIQKVNMKVKNTTQTKTAILNSEAFSEERMPEYHNLELSRQQKPGPVNTRLRMAQWTIQQLNSKAVTQEHREVPMQKHPGPFYIRLQRNYDATSELQKATGKGVQQDT